MWRLLILVLILWGLILGAGALGRVLPASAQMAFVSQRGGDDDIYLHDLSHRLTVNLTRRSDPTPGGYYAQEQSPAWSPDGRWLAFHANRAGNHDIYIMDATGRNVRRLTTHNGMDMHPKWSPDGRWLVYQSWRESDFEVYRLDVWGDAPPLALTDNDSGDRHPAFSPDGTQIVYASDAGSDLGNFSLYVMDADGGSPRRAAALRARDNALHPTWSPDGAYILFDSFADNINNSVYAVRADGRGEVIRLAGAPTRRGYDAYLPRWSPDGSQVLYVSSQASNSEIYVAPLLGGDALALGTPRRLTFNPTADIQPALRPR